MHLQKQTVSREYLFSENVDYLLANEAQAYFFYFPHVQAVFSNSSRLLVHAAPPVLPAPTPQLPPAFFNSTLSQLNSLDSFSSGDDSTAAPTLNVLDDLSSENRAGTDAVNAVQNSSTLDPLDCLDSFDSFDDILDKIPGAAAEKIIQSKTALTAGGKSLDLLDEVDIIGVVSATNGQSGDVIKVNTNATKQLDSLDSLDSFSTAEDVGAALAAVPVEASGLDILSDFSANGNIHLLVVFVLF